MEQCGKQYAQELKDGVIRIIRKEGSSVAIVAKTEDAEQTIFPLVRQDQTQQNPDKVRFREL